MRITINCKSCGKEPEIKKTPKQTWIHCQQNPLCTCGGEWDIKVTSSER